MENSKLTSLTGEDLDAAFGWIDWRSSEQEVVDIAQSQLGDDWSVWLHKGSLEDDTHGVLVLPKCQSDELENCHVVRQVLRDLMSNTFRYDKTYEAELIALLKKEPEWNSFTHTETIDIFKSALLSSQTYICKSQGQVCGYLRALVDGFGIYVSELYVAPAFRNNRYGKELLKGIKKYHKDQDVYVLSDEDLYYEKLGCKRVGSVFQI